MSNPFTMPSFPADLAGIIATHRALFGGFTMVDDTTTGQADPPGSTQGTTTDSTTTTSAAPAKPADITDEAWTALGDPGKKALVADRAKADTEKQRADTLQRQIDDAKLTAEQKSAQDLKDAREKAATAELRALKFEVAAAKGIDLKLALRLTGATKADLEKDADDLKALVGKGDGTKHAPRADRSAGAGGGDGSNAARTVAAGRDLYGDRHPLRQRVCPSGQPVAKVDGVSKWSTRPRGHQRRRDRRLTVGQLPDSCGPRGRRRAPAIGSRSPFPARSPRWVRCRDGRDHPLATVGRAGSRWPTTGRAWSPGSCGRVWKRAWRRGRWVGSTRRGGRISEIPSARRVSVHRSALGSRPGSMMPWWWGHNSTRFHRAVGPPRYHGMM